MPFVWITPETGTQIILNITMSLMAAVAEILVIRALEVAEAVVVAPIHYTLIIWGTMYGYIVFGHFPDTWTWIGTAVIISAGVFTLMRSHRKA